MKLKLMLVTAGLAAVIAGSVWWWQGQHQPRTPKEMFEVRCSECHPLRDMTRFEVEQYAGIVRGMRELHDAKRYISPEEAAIIVRYLEQTRGGAGNSAQ